MLTEEIADLRRQRDQLSLENTRKSSQVEHVSTDKDKVELQLMNAEDTIRMLRDQVIAFLCLFFWCSKNDGREGLCILVL